MRTTPWQALARPACGAPLRLRLHTSRSNNPPLCSVQPLSHATLAIASRKKVGAEATRAACIWVGDKWGGPEDGPKYQPQGGLCRLRTRWGRSRRGAFRQDCIFREEVSSVPSALRYVHQLNLTDRIRLDNVTRANAIWVGVGTPQKAGALGHY